MTGAQASAPAAAEPPPDAGAVLAEFVQELVAVEDKRRESLETRGMSVITVSGTLVTILLGLAALVTKADDFELPAAAQDRISIAVLAFIVSAVFAIATYAPQPHRTTDPDGLAEELPKRWSGPADSARKKVTATRLMQLRSAQAVNDRKALCLLAAVISQVVAIGLLAWAVERVLGSS